MTEHELWVMLLWTYVFLLFTHFRRPGDTKGVDILLTVSLNSLALLPARVDHFVCLSACWDKDLAQELVDIWRALQLYQGHEWLKLNR